jgi:hypothetical protein
MLDQAFESMADQAMAHLRAIAQAPGELEALSHGAIAGIEQRHNQVTLARALDAIYSRGG